MELKWTDELVKEFTLGAMRVQSGLPNEVSLDKGLYHFKKEKLQKQQQPIKVEVLFVNENQIMAFTVQKFDNTMLLDIKQAIENCLNNPSMIIRYGSVYNDNTNP